MSLRAIMRLVLLAGLLPVLSSDLAAQAPSGEAEAPTQRGLPVRVRGADGELRLFHLIKKEKD